MGPGEDTEVHGARRMGEASAPTSRRENAPIMPLVVMGVLASAIGIAIGLAIDWFPTAASTQAGPIDTLWDVLVIASVPMFVLVTAVVLYCVWRFRMRPGEEGLDGPPIHGNTGLEVIWTVIPAVLILGLCFYAYLVLDDIEEAKANEMQVKVVGQQFTWTFQYGEGENAVTSNDLYVVKDRSVRFAVESRDVLHDFWVPQFRMKIDAVPGIETSYRVTPNRLGEYPVVCAELCGIAHAYMRQTAHVVTQEEFDRWLQEERQGGAGGGESGGGGGGTGGQQAAADGKAIFTETGCGACHVLADAGSSGASGPNLDESLADKDAAYIEESIVEPNAQIAEGFGPGIMPPTYGEQLSDEELDALVKYIDEVTK